MATPEALPLLESVAVAPHYPPLTEHPFTAEGTERMARIFEALGDFVRLRLFSAVASPEGGEARVCDIFGTGASRPTISHHLKQGQQVS